MKLDILLPTNLSEIPLSRYQEFIAMKEKSNDEEFIAQKMIQIFFIPLITDVQIKIIRIYLWLQFMISFMKNIPEQIRE